IELRTALAEGIHLAGEEVQQRVVAILAAKIEYPVVLVVIVLAVPSSESVHAECNLVLAQQNIHVISRLKAGDWESPQRKGAAADRESTIVDGYLQEIPGGLKE